MKIKLLRGALVIALMISPKFAAAQSKLDEQIAYFQSQNIETIEVVDYRIVKTIKSNRDIKRAMDQIFSDKTPRAIEIDKKHQVDTVVCEPGNRVVNETWKSIYYVAMLKDLDPSLATQILAGEELVKANLEGVIQKGDKLLALYFKYKDQDYTSYSIVSDEFGIVYNNTFAQIFSSTAATSNVSVAVAVQDHESWRYPKDRSESVFAIPDSTATMEQKELQLKVMKVVLDNMKVEDNKLVYGANMLALVKEGVDVSYHKLILEMIDETNEGISRWISEGVEFDVANKLESLKLEIFGYNH